MKNSIKQATFFGLKKGSLRTAIQNGRLILLRGLGDKNDGGVPLDKEPTHSKSYKKKSELCPVTAYSSTNVHKLSFCECDFSSILAQTKNSINDWPTREVLLILRGSRRWKESYSIYVQNNTTYIFPFIIQSQPFAHNM